jgi:hypothetical protein
VLSSSPIDLFAYSHYSVQLFSLQAAASYFYYRQDLPLSNDISRYQSKFGKTCDYSIRSRTSLRSQMSDVEDVLHFVRH